MPRAVVLTTQSKASSAGGTFADTLAANSGDATGVANFNAGGARVLEMWGMDDTSVAEFQILTTRPESTHDQNHGVRFMVAATAGGGAGKNLAQNFLPGYGTINLFKSDVVTIQASSTVGDNLAASYAIEYDDLPGQQAVLASWDQVQNLRKSTVGIRVDAVGSATRGAYGASRAFNADDARLHANTWYAILGASVQLPVLTVSLLGPDWGGQRIGFPAGYLDLRQATWFVDQAIKWGKPVIPCFNSNNVGNVLVQVADLGASTSPKIDFLLYELTSQPGT